MRIDLREFFRRAFTIPAAKRKALKEALSRELARLVDSLLDELMDEMQRHGAAYGLHRKLARRAREWLDEQDGHIALMIRARFDELEREISRQARHVDEQIAQRLRESIESYLHRVFK